MEDLSKKEIEEVKNRILFLEKQFDIEELKKKAGSLEEQTKDLNFWNNPENAREVSQTLKEAKDDIEIIENFKNEINDLNEFYDILDESEEKEFLKRFSKLERDLTKKEIEFNFSGKYDKEHALMTISAGAGGKEAEDWAQMLFRMYQRYFEKKDFNVIILNEISGEGNEGIKEIVVEIRKKYAYGYFRREIGVHRLVRQSPFSSQKLRHTSFALVEVIPVIKEVGNIQIREEDIRMDFFRASGPGGQYVNKRDSAVRLTHLPTNTVVSCQVERSQGKNKEKAMSTLLAKLYILEEEKRQQEIGKEKGDKISAGWGNQIRSYVLHPYKMVKDLRTRVEKTNAEAVLDGEIDDFIDEEIRQLD